MESNNQSTQSAPSTPETNAASQTASATKTKSKIKFQTKIATASPTYCIKNHYYQRDKRALLLAIISSVKHPPNIDENLIISTIHENYDIHLKSLKFLPIGEGGWAYKGIGDDAREWFIKLSRVDTSNVGQVTQYLHDKVDLPFVLSTIATKHGNSASIANTFLTIFPFIAGDILGNRQITQQQLIEIANDLGQLHRAPATPQISRSLPHETFQKFQDRVPTLLYEVSSKKGSDLFIQRLDEQIQSKRQIIEKILNYSRQFSKYCQNQNYGMVICHTDIHSYNIMQTVQGLVMIDWDGTMLAPRERDLMFWKNKANTNPDFLRTYGDYQINQNLINYYSYEWVLQEFNDFIGRILDPALNSDAKEHALNLFIELFNPNDVVENALSSPLPS